MEAVARSTIQASLDASAYTAGARQIEAANRQMAGSAQAVVAAGERTEVTTNRAGRAFERVRLELDRSYAAQQRFERAQQAITRAQERGSISLTEGNLLLERARERYLGLTAANDNARRGMESFAVSTRVGALAVGVLSSALAAVTVGGLITFVRGAIDTVGGLGELADAAGVSTDALQALQFAAVGAGLKAEEVQRGIAALTRRVGDATNGSEQAQYAFRVLGIAFRETNGTARSTEAVLADIADRLQKYENPTDRARIATEFFGDRLGQRLIPLLIGGREGLEQFTQRAIEFGVVADADLIAKADQASDKIAQLSATFTSLANNLLARVAPALSTFAAALNRALTGPTATERGTSLSRQIVQAGEEIARLEQQLSGMSQRDIVRRPTVEARLDYLRRHQQGLIEQSRQIATEYEGQQQRAREILTPPVRPAATLPPLTQPQRAGGPSREERAQERLENAIREAEAMAQAQQRVADAYGQSAEAGREAEAMERALAAVRKTGAEVTGEESAAVQRLARAFEEEARARSDVASRQAERNLRQELELLEAQARTITMTAEARERELAAVRARQQIEARGGDPASNASRAYISAAENAAAARLEQERLIQGAKTFQDIGNRAADAFGKTLVDALMEGRDAFDALNETAKRVLNEILNEMLRMAVINPLKNMAFGGNAPSFFNGGAGSMGGAGGFLGSLFSGSTGAASIGSNASWAASLAEVGPFLAAANGAAFDRGNVIPFASGGIVERPTLFPMAAGTGLMGEAGPEAILPLRRGPDGKLGVSMQGNGQQMDARARRVSPRVTINVTTPDASSFRSSEGQIAATASRVLQRAGRNL